VPSFTGSGPGARGPAARAALEGILRRVAAVLLASLNARWCTTERLLPVFRHMAQHLLLTLVFPPLLILGLPGWLVEPLLKPAPVRRVARVLTHPVAAAVIFTATIAVWHVSQYYDLMMRDHDVHIVTHLMFMATATLLWWPVMSPVPEVLPRLGYGLGMLYLFLVGIPMHRRRVDHAERRRTCILVLGRAARLGALAAGRSAARRTPHVGAGNLYMFLVIEGAVSGVGQGIGRDGRRGGETFALAQALPSVLRLGRSRRDHLPPRWSSRTPSGPHLRSARRPPTADTPSPAPRTLERKRRRRQVGVAGKLMLNRTGVLDDASSGRDHAEADHAAHERTVLVDDAAPGIS
jgi:hypothetical protein